MEPRRILIVANQTALGPHLKEAVLKKIQEGPAVFTLVVPASAPSDHVWTEAEIQAGAHERLHEALQALREVGAEIQGVVGDKSPIYAITDALVERPHDEIIVSTFPPGVSRWLRQDLPHRIERVFRLPTTHVVAQPAMKA